MRNAGLVVVLAAVATATPARADEPRVAISATLGAMTPLGILGIEVEPQLTPWLRLGAGVGVGASGAQVALMPRFTMQLSPSSSFEGGVGVSTGRYVWNEPLVFEDDAAQKTWKHAIWLNGELAIRTTFGPRWSGRLFGGFGTVLNTKAYTCNNDHCRTGHADDGNRLPYFGLSAARWI